MSWPICYEECGCYKRGAEAERKRHCQHQTNVRTDVYRSSNETVKVVTCLDCFKVFKP